ncbi:MAG: antibiotic biosynthesis monooxygenase [Deltaproteobacteria bacterium]|nr:antibiotic biosynthesis monooxygenase [Deltaproteobacteria bacterium]
MYVRMVYLNLKEGKMDEFRILYTNEVIQTVKKHKGNRFVHLLECRENENEGISLTAWDTSEDFEKYLQSGDYERLTKKYEPMYAIEPLLKSYEVTASSEPLILRIF